MDEALVRIFRQVFEGFVGKREIPELPAVLPRKLKKVEGGIYVAAFENPGKKPRGRVGSYMPLKSTLAEEIQFWAVELARTFPFRKQDLPFLQYEISLVKTPCLLASIDHLEAQNGLLVRSDMGKTGVSLPNSKYTDPGQRLKEAYRRAGIQQLGSSVRLYQFEVQQIHEPKRRKV